MKKAGELARRYGGSLDKGDAKRLYAEVNCYMRDKADREENILGTLYVEDFARCKPPRFAHGDLVKRLRVADGGGPGVIVTPQRPDVILGDY